MSTPIKPPNPNIGATVAWRDTARCPACHDTECCGAGPDLGHEAHRKALAAIARLTSARRLALSMEKESSVFAYGALDSAVEGALHDLRIAFRLEDR